jgi:hypothetical protein
LRLKVQRENEQARHKGKRSFHKGDLISEEIAFNFQVILRIFAFQSQKMINYVKLWSEGRLPLKSLEMLTERGMKLRFRVTVGVSVQKSNLLL